jgi:hypothetical protein
MRFCSQGTELCGLYECRGTSLISDWELSRYCYFVNSSGAVRIYHRLRICHGSRSKSKNHDELINYTGVVSKSAVLIMMQNLSKG